MATITRENIGLLNDKLVVNIAKEDYYTNFDKGLKGYAKNANIPGFRKGMVPAGLVKKMYGQSIMTDEIFKAVDQEVAKYVNDEKLPILVQPIPFENANDNVHIDVNNPQDYTFAFEVGIEPEINIDPKNIKVTRYKIEVTDTMVDEEINKLQLRHGKYSEPETLSNDDDVINVELQESDKDGNLLENGVSESTSILLKNVTPALRKQLQGQKKDFKTTIQLSQAFVGKELENVLAQLGFESDDNDAAQKYFQLTLLKLGAIERPAMDEEFFKLVYPTKEDIKSEADFKAEIKKELENYFAQQASGQIHDQIYHELADHTKLEFPTDFLKRWLTLQNDGKKTAEEIEQEVPKLEKQLQWNIISNKLSKDNDVKVEPADLREFAIQQLYGYLGGQMDLSGDTSWMNQYVDKMMQDKKFIEQSYGQVMAAKLFTVLEGQVTVKDEPISEQDFAKKLQEHHHHH
ncbi:MAG: trigger factor [Chitinophagaceae bacterium]